MKTSLLISLLFVSSIFATQIQWKDSVQIDSLITIAQDDTLIIEPSTRIIVAQDKGMRVQGRLLMAADSINPITWTGGRGILLASGGSAVISGLHMQGTTHGITAQNGANLVLYHSQLQSPGSLKIMGAQVSVAKTSFLGNGTKISVDSGALAMEDCLTQGTGTAFHIKHTSQVEIEDSWIQGDTLWVVDSTSSLRLHDSQWNSGVRLGKALQSKTQQAKSENTSKPEQWAISMGVEYGRRAAAGQPSLDVLAMPVQLLYRPHESTEILLSSGALAGFRDQRTELRGRDRSQLALRWVSPQGLSLSALGGYGGDTLTWTINRWDMAQATLDPSMDMIVPLASPGPFAGGLLGYRGAFLFGTELDVSAGYQWRGSVQGTDYGDLWLSTLQVKRNAKGIKTLGYTQFVYATADQTDTVSSSERWQWLAQLDQRHQKSKSVWGYQLKSDLRDHAFIAGDVRFDYLWVLGVTRIGPQMGGIFTFNEADLGGAAGLGGKLQRSLGSMWDVQMDGWLRWHQDLKGSAWIGGDLALKIIGRL